MIFITPYIIKNETEASEITKKKGDALEEFRKEYRIEKKEGGAGHFHAPGPVPTEGARAQDRRR